jgi:hypothetical protein
MAIEAVHRAGQPSLRLIPQPHIGAARHVVHKSHARPDLPRWNRHGASCIKAASSSIDDQGSSYRGTNNLLQRETRSRAYIRWR